MDDSLGKLRKLYQIWLQRNQDLTFYFENLFEPSLELLQERFAATFDFTLAKGPRFKKYASLFVPVGYSFESVALVSCLFEPDYLTLGYSEAAGRFFRKGEMELKKNILKVCPKTRIEALSVSDSDNKGVEAAIQKWIEVIAQGYGISLSQIAVDITSGTKPMAVGLQNVAQVMGIDAYYLRVDYDEDTLLPLPGTEQLLRIYSPPVDDRLIFVIMPFSEEFSNIYNLGIRGAAEALGYSCLRVDEEIYLGGIMDKIRENITKARFVVADISVYNPNVYYELGLAEGMKKDIIMITNNIDTLPFDLRHRRVVRYDALNIRQLKDNLEENLKELKR